MRTRYILRLDDACETMHWDNWMAFERLLDVYNIRPVVAVIPDNKDRSLYFSDPKPDFWDVVRKWEDKGWVIAMHGYQHLYQNYTGFSFVPLWNKTEFCGLSLEEQKFKISKSWEIFLRNGVKPKIFVAPSHSFDKNTLLALHLCTEIRIISDCFAFWPFYESGFYFIPQQLWKFYKFPFGVWTICLHPNVFRDVDFIYWERIFKSYSYLFTDLNALLKFSREWSVFEKFINFRVWYNGNIRQLLRNIKGCYKILRRAKS